MRLRDYDVGDILYINTPKGQYNGYNFQIISKCNKDKHHDIVFDAILLSDNKLYKIYLQIVHDINTNIPLECVHGSFLDVYRSLYANNDMVGYIKIEHKEY